MMVRNRDVHLCHQGVREGGLAMVHMGDHRHVPDVLLLVHALPHLVHREVHHDELLG